MGASHGYDYWDQKRAWQKEKEEADRQATYDSATRRSHENEEKLANMTSQISSLQEQLKKQAAAQKKAKPKPKREGDQQIKPSSEPSQQIQQAQETVEQGADGNQPSAWEQAQANSADNVIKPPSTTSSSTSSGPEQHPNTAQARGIELTNQSGTKTTEAQEQAQDLADKYKLALISSGATAQNQTDFTARVPEQHMSSDEILANDSKMYGGQDGSGFVGPGGSQTFDESTRKPGGESKNVSGPNTKERWDQYKLPNFANM